MEWSYLKTEEHVGAYGKGGGAQISGTESPGATKFCMVASNIRGTSVPKLLHITLSAPKILKWFQYLWQMNVPLCNSKSRSVCFPIASKPKWPAQPSSH
jgi:hypothetical protein